MAVNLLPIVLVGGAAAVVVSQGKKKDKKKCPPTTVITLGEMKTVATRAVAQHGSTADPADEANYFVNQVLPPGCNRSSVNSKVKIQIPGSKNDFEMTIPDVYMLTFAQLLATRVDAGALSEQEADRLWARELDWYKKTTGTNFDAERTGLVEFGKAVLESVKKAMDDMMGGNGAKPKPGPKPGGCPKMFEWVVDPLSIQSMEGIISASIEGGERDPFKVADHVLASIAPASCSKSDYETIIRTVLIKPGLEEPESKTGNLSAFYGMMVWTVANGMLDRNLIGPPKLDAIKAKILNDYQKLTGELFPEKL